MVVEEAAAAEFCCRAAYAIIDDFDDFWLSMDHKLHFYDSILLSPIMESYCLFFQSADLNMLIAQHVRW